MMIKSNGGSGSVSNVVFENFIGHSNAYSLDVDQYWSSMSTVDGDGVSLSNMTFSNWSGTCASGTQRGPIKFACADGAPCTDMTVRLVIPLIYSMLNRVARSPTSTCGPTPVAQFTIPVGRRLGMVHASRIAQRRLTQWLLRLLPAHRLPTAQRPFLMI